MLDVSENDSFDNWLGHTAGSSSLKGRVSDPTSVGLDVGFEFGAAGVRWMFSSIDHMLGFREEPFMKEALESRATSRESSGVAGGDWTICCISLVIDEASGSTGGTSDPDASTGMGLWGSRCWHEVYSC